MSPAPARPVLAIVTVCLDHRDGLARTHASLAAQPAAALACIEWLVQDGGSTDGSAGLAAVLAGPAADLCSGADSGPYEGMSRALRRATAGHVLFLNAGDALAEADTLARLLEALGGSPDLLYGDALERSAAGWRRKPARPPQRAWAGLFTHHPALVYRRALLGPRPFDPRFRIAADYDLTLAVLARAGTVRRLPFAVARVEPAGLSARLAALGRAEQRAIRAERLGTPAALNRAITAAQAGAWAVRRRLPGAYARLRLAGPVAGPPGSEP